MTWTDRALCAETDPELFFPEVGGATAALAKQVCAACEVQTECLEYAMEHREVRGIWGGMTERQRDQLRKQQRRAA